MGHPKIRDREGLILGFLKSLAITNGFLIVDSIYFLIKYIPFWCVPFSIMGLQFGIIYRLKGLGFISMTFFMMAFFCSALIVYYFWTGGPVKSVQFFIDIVNSFYF
jgi:hypothetical protein